MSRTPHEGARKQHEEQPDERLMYLSRVIAYDAAKEDVVTAFQREVLNGELIRLENVKSWIDDMLEKDRIHNPYKSQTYYGGRLVITHNPKYDTTKSVRGYAKIILPPGTEMTVNKRGWVPNQPIVVDKEGMITSVEQELLSYVAPKTNTVGYTVRTVPVYEDGVLERLNRIGKYLNDNYTLTRPSAVTFVLTGETPLILPAHANLTFCSYSQALNSMTLYLRPYLSPNEVKDIYERARRQLVSPIQKRNRSMSKKHLELAVFYHEFHVHKGMKGPEMMEAWNSQHPEWGYKIVTIFDRDAKHAFDRLMIR